MVLLTAACSIWTALVYAECVSFGPWGMKYDSVEVVFDGTVVGLKQTGEMQIAQMQVHRVFEGHLPPLVEVYHRPNMEVSAIEAGQRYVLPLLRMNPSGTGVTPHRPFVEPKNDPSLVWATWGCGGVLRGTLLQEGTLDQLGRGWPPER